MNLRIAEEEAASPFLFLPEASSLEVIDLLISPKPLSKERERHDEKHPHSKKRLHGRLGVIAHYRGYHDPSSPESSAYSFAEPRLQAEHKERAGENGDGTHNGERCRRRLSRVWEQSSDDEGYIVCGEIRGSNEGETAPPPTLLFCISRDGLPLFSW